MAMSSKPTSGPNNLGIALSSDPNECPRLPRIAVTPKVRISGQRRPPHWEGAAEMQTRRAVLTPGFEDHLVCSDRIRKLYTLSDSSTACQKGLLMRFDRP